VEPQLDITRKGLTGKRRGGEEMKEPTSERVHGVRLG